MTADLAGFVLNTNMSHGACWVRSRASGTLRCFTLRSFTLCGLLRLGLGGAVFFFGGLCDRT